MSGPREERSAHARRWLALAEGDLDSARLLVTHGAVALRNAAFHAQQASEKGLKALLVANGLTVPRTHSLPRLVTLLPETQRPLSSVELSELDPWAVEGRYAQEANELTATDAELLVALAARTLTSCRGLLDALEQPKAGPATATSSLGDPPPTDQQPG